MEIQIKNFRLNVFKNLIEQSLIVDSQLMFQISTDYIRSCSFSGTKSFMKLWTIPFKSMIFKPEKKEDETVESLDEPVKEEEVVFDFPVFNMYILKGDLFKKFLSVHTNETVDLTIDIQEVSGKYFGSRLTITGKSEGNNNLTTHFILTTEELISNKIEDYSEIISEATPDKTMFNFVLSDKQIQEVKRMVKKLHKSSGDNTAYLTFTVNSENREIIVNDKVFTLAFQIDEEIQKNIVFPEESFKFNILKSDFVILGNQSFNIHTNATTPKVIFGAAYAGSVIWALTTKIDNVSELNLDQSIVDSTIDNLDDLEIDEYFD